jgi:hypothetical protein
MGPSTQAGKAASRQEKAKLAIMNKRLDELAMWHVVGSKDSMGMHRLKDEEVKDMLRT